MVNVVKKNGQLESFDSRKIKRAIAFACEGLDVNPLALESKFDEFIREGIKTTTIQDNLILHAKSLASPQDTQWAIVAGRLMTMNLWSARKSYDVSFSEWYNSVRKTGEWCHPNFDIYSPEDIVFFGTLIDKNKDLSHSIASIETATKKYLYPNECIQQMMMGNAMVLASVEEPHLRRFYVATYYQELSDRTISLATPQLMNLRKGKNTGSCFIIEPDDDLDSIYDSLKDAARISKNGGGIGFYLGRCRSKGSSLMGVKEAATGVIGWAKLVNDTMVSVNQGGKRKGAATVALPVWHNDLEDFLELQTETGDQRSKAYDIQPQVTVFDYFMELKNDAEAIWYTFDPYEVEMKAGISLPDSYCEEFERNYKQCVELYKQGLLTVVKEYNAKKLWIKVLKVSFEKGKPYIAFIDTINRLNPNKHVGNIPCVNLCTESFSVVKADKYAHTCSLASVVVGRVPLERLSYVASICTRMLDNGITLTKPPIPESEAHMRDFRTIGVGIQGYHDIIAREWKSFTDTTFATEVAERIQFGCVSESIKLAKERGAYPLFTGSEWDNGNMFSNYINNSVCPDLDWQKQLTECQKYGIRNSQLTSPAPNTSTSLFMDAAAGATPVYGAFFYEDNSTGKTPVSGMFLQSNPLSYSRTIGTYKADKLVPTIAAMQKFVDTGISAEFLFDRNLHDITAQWVWDLYEKAWREGMKAVYYLRTIKVGESLVEEPEICASCSG